MNKIFRTLMIAVIAVGTACTSQAQNDKDKKITIQITKQVDGEMKTFKGEYASEEEMRADPAYQEFAGDDDNVFFFGGEGDHDSFIQLHRGHGGNAFSFSMDDDDFLPHNFMKNFKFRNGNGSAFFFGDDDSIFGPNHWNSEEYEEELQEKMEDLEEKLKDLDEDLREDIMESMKEMQEMHSSMGLPKRIKRNIISISDVDDDFGKKGKVSKDEKLELDDLNFMVMRNRLNLRFRVKDEGELTVKISNENGKDIYNRYYESYGGTFSDMIDFSKYSEGKYLLEIQLDKKRLTKKVVIE